MNMFTCFRSVPKSMSLNDLRTRLRAIYSLNAAKMTKYSLVMTPTPCRVTGCITFISIRPTYSCNGALTYLFVYLHSCLGEYKTGISPKRLKIERRLLLTVRLHIENNLVVCTGGGSNLTHTKSLFSRSVLKV